jgi:hypothetical protein
MRGGNSVAEKCRAPHPKDAARLCDNHAVTHAEHWDRAHPGEWWPNEEAHQRLAMMRTQKSGRKSGRSKGLAQVAAAIIVSKRGDLPSEAREKWLKEPWVAYAGEEFIAFLKGREEPFTTAEDVWPRLETPEEMRALSLVTRRMLADRLMVEVGAVRLKGTYFTKDGTSFKENKLVPIYQSTICSNRQGDRVL